LFVPQLRSVLSDNPFIWAWEAKGAPSGQLFRAWELVKPEEVEKWKHYSTWAKPLSFYWTIATVVYERQPFLTPKNNLVVLRGKDSPKYEKSDLQAMELLVPHLQRALLIHWRLRFHERKHMVAQQVLDRLAVSVILLDSKSKIIMMNRSAEALASQ